MKARQWIIYLADNEWGNEVMARICREKFAADPTLDFITINEHAGWYLSWNRDMVCVSTANDMARLSPEARTWRHRFEGIDLVGYERRQIKFEHKYESYYPCLAVA